MEIQSSAPQSYGNPLLRALILKIAMPKFLTPLVVTCTLVAHCRSSGGADLVRYAGPGAAEENGYLYFYAQGQKLSLKSQTVGKLRAYLFAAMQTPDLKLACAAWECAPKTLASLRKSERSPLYNYAAYHLAKLAESQGAFTEALELIGVIADAPVPLARKVSLLTGKLLALTAAPPQLRIGHWRSHVDKYPDAESLYFAAHGLELAGDKSGAEAMAWRALEKPEADFPFAQSGLLLRNALHRGIYTQPTVMQRIRLMEALRVAKDRASAFKLWQSLIPLKLFGDEKMLFVHYAARLLADKGNFAELAELVKSAGADFFAIENEKAALHTCERLLKKKQFTLVKELFVLEPASKSALQCRLRLFQRSSHYSPAVRPVAARYLTEFDKESTLAERIFLRSCLPGVGTHREQWDIPCLEESGAN